MIPIYEQCKGNGIGHSFNSFNQRFDAICTEHLASSRPGLRLHLLRLQGRWTTPILKDQGVFAQLDRLSGTDLRIFYLHTGSRPAIKKFNERFLAALGVTDQAQLPCVVFFKVINNQIEDIEIAQLDSANLIHGFHELYSAVEHYLATTPVVHSTESSAIKWLKSGSRFVGLEMFRAALKRGFDFLF